MYDSEMYKNLFVRYKFTKLFQGRAPEPPSLLLGGKLPGSYLPKFAFWHL